MLTLPEELLLLSIDDEGRTHCVTQENLEVGLFTACVLELVSSGRLELSQCGVYVIDSTPTSDATLNEVLLIFLETKRTVPMAEILLELMTSDGQLIALHNLIVQGLVEKGVLRLEQDKVLWVLPRRHLETAEPKAEQRLTQRLLEVLLHHKPADSRTEALLGIIQTCFSSDDYLREELFEGLRVRMKEVVESASGPVIFAREAIGEAMARRHLINPLVGIPVI